MDSLLAGLLGGVAQWGAAEPERRRTQLAMDETRMKLDMKKKYQDAVASGDVKKMQAAAIAMEPSLLSSYAKPQSTEGIISKTKPKNAAPTGYEWYPSGQTPGGEMLWKPIEKKFGAPKKEAPPKTNYTKTLDDLITNPQVSDEWKAWIQKKKGIMPDEQIYNTVSKIMQGGTPGVQ